MATIKPTEILANDFGVFMFPNKTSLGFDRAKVSDTCVVLDYDGQLKIFSILTEAGLNTIGAPNITVEKYLSTYKEGTDYILFSSEAGLRKTYPTKQDMIDDPKPKDFQLSKTQDTQEEYIYTVEPVVVPMPGSWIRGKDDSGYFKPVVSKKSLRLSPVADITELQTIEAEHYMITRVEDSGLEYVFEADAKHKTPVADGIPDGKATGKWVLAQPRKYELVGPRGGADAIIKTEEILDEDKVRIFIDKALQHNWMFDFTTPKQVNFGRQPKSVIELWTR